jgi:hypothetical protein
VQTVQVDSAVAAEASEPRTQRRLSCAPPPPSAQSATRWQAPQVL